MRLPCQALDITVATIERVRQRFVEPGLAPALGRKQPLQHPSRALDGEQEAHLIAIALYFLGGWPFVGRCSVAG